VESYGSDVLCGSVGVVYKLVGVEVWGEIVVDVLKNQCLKALHDYQSEGCGMVII